MSYNIIAKHPLNTRRRGEVVDSVDKLTDANKAVHKWQTYFGTEWKVEYRIVRS